MFTILCVGKLKESWWRQAAEEYLKRLGPFLPVRVVEIPETPFGKNDDVERVKKDEANRLIKYLKPHTYIVALHAKTKHVAFAERLATWQRKQEVVLVIGGPRGLHESILERANELLSLSPFTFTHQMARVILLEQIYRALLKDKNKYDY